MKKILLSFLTSILFLFSSNSFAKIDDDNLACPTATISYSNTHFCQQNPNNFQAVTLTGTDNYLGGTFSSTVGLNINSTTGEINLAASSYGTYNVTYTIPTDGTCPAVTATAIVVILPSNTVSAPSSTPTLCVNTVLMTITHTTTSATGIGVASGLPSGVTASWVGNTITISGVPTQSGIFNYTIPLTGGCATVNATGTITVTSDNYASNPSSTPTMCLNSPISPAITHTTTGATGIGTVTGLPPGVTASWSGNTITIVGTPTVYGTFNYTVPLTGGGSCGNSYATGTITVIPNNTIQTGTSQTVCHNNAITPIVLSTTGGATGATFSGLPTGVTGIWAGGIVSINGTPTSPGIFNYTVSLTGGCGTVTTTGTIIVNPTPTGITISPISSITCAGIPVNLTVTGTPGSVITWSNGPSSFTIGASGNVVLSVAPTITTTYTITSASNGGCATPIVGQSATVIVNNTPQFVTQIPDMTICNGGMLNIASQLTSTLPGTTYIWTASTSNINNTIISGDQTNLDQFLNLLDPSTAGTFAINVVPKIGNCNGTPQTIIVNVTPIPTIFSTVANSNTVCNNGTVTITANSNSTATAYNWQVTNATGVQIVGGANSGTSATGILNLQLYLTNSSVSGTISFNFTPVNGNCTGATVTNAVTITVNRLPGSPLALPSFEICRGDALNLTIASFPSIAGTMIEWTVTDSQYVTGFTNGSSVSPFTINDILINSTNLQGFVKYSATSKLGNCYGGTTDYIVYVNPSPDVSTITAGAITIDGNGNIIPYVIETGLNPTDYSFSWYLNQTLIAGANSNNFTASEEGEYAVDITNLLTNCTNHASVSIIQNLIDNGESDDLVMFPNPSSDTVNFNYINKVKSVKITNQMGQTIFTKEINLKNGSIDITNLNIGIYNIEFETDTEIVSKRIIKN